MMPAPRKEGGHFSDIGLYEMHPTGGLKGLKIVLRSFMDDPLSVCGREGRGQQSGCDLASSMQKDGAERIMK